MPAAMRLMGQLQAGRWYTAWFRATNTGRGAPIADFPFRNNEVWWWLSFLRRLSFGKSSADNGNAHGEFPFPIITLIITRGSW